MMMLVFVIESIDSDLNIANINFKLSLQTFRLTVINLQRERTVTLYRKGFTSFYFFSKIFLIIVYIGFKKYPSIEFSLFTRVFSPILWRYSIFLSKSASIPPEIYSSSFVCSSFCVFCYLVSTSFFSFLICVSISSMWTRNLMAMWPTMKIIWESLLSKFVSTFFLLAFSLQFVKENGKF